MPGRAEDLLDLVAQLWRQFQEQTEENIALRQALAATREDIVRIRDALAGNKKREAVRIAEAYREEGP